MRFKNQDQHDNRADYSMGGMPAACGLYNQMPVMPMSQPIYQMPSNIVPQNQPALPSGFPTGPTTTPLLPANTAGMPATPISDQTPATVQSPLFTPGFLRTQIGRRMRVEFLIGTNLLTDRTGTLVGVGASYILLQPVDSDDIQMCDIYSIKFVTIIL
jgi:hypothetical protein